MLFVKLHSHNLYANTNSALDTTDTQAETTQVLLLEWNFWYHPPLLASSVYASTYTLLLQCIIIFISE